MDVSPSSPCQAPALGSWCCDDGVMTPPDRWFQSYLSALLSQALIFFPDIWGGRSTALNGLALDRLLKTAVSDDLSSGLGSSLEPGPRQEPGCWIGCFEIRRGSKRSLCADVCRGSDELSFCRSFCTCRGFCRGSYSRGRGPCRYQAGCDAMQPVALSSRLGRVGCREWNNQR